MKMIAWAFGLGLSIVVIIFGVIAYIVIEDSHPRRSNRSMYLSILADLNIAGDFGKIDIKKKSPGGSNRIPCFEKYNIEELHEADVNECDFTKYSDVASDACPIFSVGNTCIAIMVPGYVYNNKVIYSRVEDVIRDPCKFVSMFKSEIIYRDANYVFDCDEKLKKPKYSVYVLVFDNFEQEAIPNKYDKLMVNKVVFYSNEHNYYLLSIRGFFHFI